MPSFQVFEPTVERLAWTLGHFLWQGLAIGLLLALTLKLGRVRRPQVRYVFSVIAFVAMSIAPVVTFLVPTTSGFKTESVPRSAAQPTIVVEASLLQRIDSPLAEGIELGNLTPPAKRRTEAWIVVSWLIGVALFSTRLLCGWIGVLRLKRRAMQAPDWLEDRAHQLARLMNLACPPLRLSTTVPDAIAVGFLKPMILLPVAWVTEVPVNMLEAIIAHELAHIRRRDLWVNLFQRIVESLFFYHPAVWWLSHRIRTERELCSDQLAVEILQSPIQYAETLEYVARLSHSPRHVSLAVSIGGTRSILLSRVINVLRRPEGSSLDWVAGAIPLVMIATVWCLASLFQNERALAKDPIKPPSASRASAKVEKTASQETEAVPEWWDETLESLPSKILTTLPAKPDPWADWQDDTVRYNAEVAALVNGKLLLKGEVLSRYSGYLKGMRQGQPRKVTPADYVKVRDMFVQRDLSSHIQRMIVIDHFKSGLNSGELDALRRHCDHLFESEIEKLKRELNVTTREELEAALRLKETSLAEVKHAFVTERTAMEGVAKMLPKHPPITRDEIEAYYNSNTEEFAQPATVTWDEIQVSFETADEKVSALRKILLARQELRADVPFEMVAEKYSDGRFAKTGGRWDKMEAGTLKYPEFEQSLFEMPLETLSQTQEGLSQYRLAIVRDRQKAGVASLDEVADRIRKKLELDRRKISTAKLFQEMMADAVIETTYEWPGKKSDE